MTRLNEFAIASRWPATHPDRIQLYSYPSPNGIKVSIMLEETGLPYEPHLVDIMQNDSWTDPFLALNPNGKIPAIIDPEGPAGKPLALFESGAILIYLAEKSGKLMPSDPALKHETIQWLFFQAAHIGPTIGHFAWFSRYAGNDIEDKRPYERFRVEGVRILSVIETRLKSRTWIMGDDYTIADIQLFPWVRGARDYLKAQDTLELNQLPRTMDWLDRAIDRPASRTGCQIPRLPD